MRLKSNVEALRMNITGEIRPRLNVVKHGTRFEEVVLKIWQFKISNIMQSLIFLELESFYRFEYKKTSAINRF